jgi:hypothetical protein
LLSSASAGIFVYAARVLCAGPFFIAKVSRSEMPVPVSRCAERFVDLYFPLNVHVQPGHCSFCVRAGITFADFSVRSGEPMRRPGARSLGLGLHDWLLVQIQLLYLRSAFRRKFLL